MLLYTKVAPPKVPKKRSRAGCNYCKEKKKKCDEVRPQCARCIERGEECVYEPVKPRQRRKREGLTLNTTRANSARPDRAHQVVQQPPLSIQQWEWEKRRQAGKDTPTAAIEEVESLDDYFGQIPMSATTMNSDTESYFTAWTLADTAVFTPTTTATFDLASTLDECSLAQDTESLVEEIIRHDDPTSSSSLALTHHQTEPALYLEYCSPSFAEFSTLKNRRFLVDHFCNVLSHLIVFREENGNPFQHLVLPLCQRSPAVMDAVYALASAHLEFRGVDPGEKSDVFHGKAIQALARLIERGSTGNRNELLAAIMLIVYYEVLVQRSRSSIVDGHLKGAMTLISDSDNISDPTGVFLERAFGFYDVIAALSFGTAPLSTSPGRGSLFPLPPLNSSGATCASSSVDTLLGMATTLWPVIHRLSTLVSLQAELDAAIAANQVSKIAVLRTELESTTAAIQVALTQWQPILPEEDSDDEDKDDSEAASAERSERSRLRSIANNALAYRHSAFVYLYRTVRKYPRRHALVQLHAHRSLSHCVGTVRNEGPMSALLWPLFVAACEAAKEEDKELARQAFAAIDKRQGMANIDQAWKIVQEVWRRADDEEKEEEEEGDERVESVQGTNNSEISRNINGGKEMGVVKRDSGVVNTRVLPGRGVGADLWRRVSQDMGVTIVFG